MRPIEVETTSLADAASSIRANGNRVQSVRSSIGADTGDVSSGAGSPAAGAAFTAMIDAWTKALGDLGENLDDFARNTEAAAVLYERADLVSMPPAKPKPPPPPKEQPCRQTLFGSDCSNLVA